MVESDLVSFYISLCVLCGGRTIVVRLGCFTVVPPGLNAFVLVFWLIGLGFSLTNSLIDQSDSMLYKV